MFVNHYFYARLLTRPTKEEAEKQMKNDKNRTKEEEELNKAVLIRVRIVMFIIQAKPTSCHFYILFF